MLLPSIDAGRAAPARKVAKARPKPCARTGEMRAAKFRIVVDVGHTLDSYGALSARNDPEFGFNFRLARLVTAKLKSEGFTATRLLVTDGKARPSLFKRVSAANDGRADLVLSIHHDLGAGQAARDLGIRRRKELFQRPLFGSLAVRVRAQSALHQQPEAGPDDRQAVEGAGPALCQPIHPAGDGPLPTPAARQGCRRLPL